MYVGVALRPPPVAEKGSKALSEITSKMALLFGYKIKYSYRLKSISKEIGFFYLAKSD